MLYSPGLQMTVGDWLRQAQANLEAAKVDTARLDCLVLLADELSKDKSWLLSHPEYELQGSILKILNTKVTQRVMHAPLAYIRGHAEFYGRDFMVNPHTLVPRPETESIIKLVKSLEPAAGTRILDIGTGSGCIAITAALEIPNAELSACDIDKNCLETARQNAQNLDATVTFFESNLVNQATQQDILLANLPYVPDNFQINTAATHEPHHALFGGLDGLDLYRTLFAQLAKAGWQPQYILAESLPFQHEALGKIAKLADFTLRATDGFIQLFERQ